MKKITISYISVAVVVVLVALILVIHFKNKKLQQYQSEKIEELNSKFYTAVDLIEKQEQKIKDTISYYEKVLKRNDVLVEEKNARIALLRGRILTISTQVASTTSDEDYGFLQTILEPKADSLRFSFSANQIKQLVKDETELTELRPLCSEYEQLADLLRAQISHKDDMISAMSEKENLLNDKFSECEKLNDKLDKELKKALKKKKNTANWNKALTVVTGLAIVTTLLK
jgi:hypothetical protein